MDDDDVHIPIPREVFLRIVSSHPNLSSIEPFSTNADWALVGRAFTEVAQDIIPSYRSHSPSFSTGSSPTLMPSTSRASSLAPGGCDDDLFNPDGSGSDDGDIPSMDLDDKDRMGHPKT